MALFFLLLHDPATTEIDTYFNTLALHEALPISIVGRRPLALDRIDALAGRFSLDAATPLTADTWTSAYWGAQSVLAALDAVRGGDRAAFALCRPPGHHAERDYLGGYCHLNTAAIAEIGRAHV